MLKCAHPLRLDARVKADCPSAQIEEGKYHKTLLAKYTYLLKIFTNFVQTEMKKIWAKQLEEVTAKRTKKRLGHHHITTECVGKTPHAMSSLPSLTCRNMKKFVTRVNKEEDSGDDVESRNVLRLIWHYDMY